jgi:tetratricopeptide (TPR) repeat protein
VARILAGYQAGVQERLRQAEKERSAAEARAAEAQARASAERRARRLTAALAVAGLLLVCLAGGVASWSRRVEAERAGRRAATERDVSAALNEALTFGGQARQATASPDRWQALLAAALSAARRAEGLLNSGEPADELRQRVGGVLAGLLQDEQDRALVAELDDVRLRQTEQRGGRFDVARSAPLYAAAFRGHGPDLPAAAPAEAAALLRARPVCEALLGALEDWEQVTAEAVEQRRLGAILNAADPDATSFRNRRRRAYARQDRAALEALVAEAKGREVPAVVLVSLSRDLSALGSAEGAVRLLREGQRRYPDDFWVNHHLAAALRSLKPPQLEEAVGYYRAALALRGRSSGAHVNLGLTLARLGRYDEAVRSYHRALELDPAYAVAYTNLAIARVRQRRFAEAACSFHRALALEPEQAQAYTTLGFAFQAQGHRDEAIRCYRTALGQDPRDARALTNLGVALFEKGQPGEALCCYRAALAAGPPYAPAYSSLGIALAARGQLDEAVRCYRTALRIDPRYALAHTNLGLALHHQRRFDEAVACHRKALALDPTDARFHINLGSTFHAKGRPDEAARCFREALRLEPDNAEAHCNLGIALIGQGRFRAALASVRRGQQAGASRPGWREATARLARDAEQWVRLEGKLPAVLRGEESADAGECLQLAWHCLRHKRCHRAAARLYAQAFARAPAAAADLSGGYRYAAACAAALAGRGKGEDAGELDEKERARLRQQALDWLRADLALWAKRADRRQALLGRWQDAADLAGVRDAAALATLPADERAAWQKLWAEVAALLAK